MASKLKKAINSSKPNYQVPSQDGRFISATPQSLCLKFKPPTIAVVYTMSVQGAPTAKQVPANKKFVHHIRVDFNGNSNVDLERLGIDLIQKESVYLNPQFISKQQVISLLQKLYDKEFAGGNKENQNHDKAKQESEQSPALNINKLDNKTKDSDDLSDFDKPSKNNNNFGKLDQAEESDDWDFAVKEESNSKNNSKALNKKSPDKQSAALNLNTDRDLESEGGFNLDELPTDQFNNEHDKFNKVMSTNNHGGLLASIGLKNADGAEGEDEDEDNYADDFDDDFADHNDDLDPKKDNKQLTLESKQVPTNGKKDIFDTSGTRDQAKKRDIDNDSEIGGDNYDFDIQHSDDEEDHQKSKDLLANSNQKKNQNDTSQQQQEVSLSAEEEQKAIEEQFQLLYEGDEELRRALAKQDVTKLTYEEKYEIIEAYMASNGASGLQFEIEDEDGEEGEEVDPDVIEEKFKQLCEQSPQLKEMVDVNALSLEQKYHILNGGLEGLEGFEDEEDQEIFEHEGKQYRKVKIQGEEGEFLMDEDENIYDLQLNKLGNAGDSDGEDDAAF